ncbi:hypothetical protein H2200_013223 [Cladophialophora chaetospira]|uniref:Uncharacterized protein n=1 Tax=Cladophialophora chaetospira TaxID=386627 RepID=A0AA38WWD1_9EURO|nr:hypothetical protein H2200_013223 [Cladophialophora chaetospira]
MSLLPYWLGLRHMTYNKPKPQNLSERTDESSALKNPAVTMGRSSEQISKRREPLPAENDQALESVDEAPPNLLQEPLPCAIRRPGRLEGTRIRLREEGRQNLQHREEQRTEAVQKAKATLETRMLTSVQATNLQQQATPKKRRKKRKTTKKNQAATQEPQIIAGPLAFSGCALSLGDLDEEQQQAHQARMSQDSASQCLSTVSPSSSIAVGHPEQHIDNGGNVVSHAKDREHHLYGVDLPYDIITQTPPGSSEEEVKFRGRNQD